MRRVEFNLIDQPWIPMMTRDGQQREVGLRDLFQQATNIWDVMCETAPMTIAVHRLLLAIVHRATSGPADDTTWAAWWRDGLPTDRIISYLEEYHNRFDLFHPEYPFAQDADLVGKAKSVQALIPESKMWPSRRERLSPAEAARWVLWLHAWDPGGMRGRHGGGNAPGTPVGPLAQAMHVRLVAESLEQTMLLSLLPYIGGHDDCGWWERPRRSEEELAPAKKVPTSGLVHRLCWPSRRVLLTPPNTDGTVGTLLLAAGDGPDSLTNVADPTAAPDALNDRGDRWLPRWLGLDTQDDGYPTVLTTLTQRAKAGLVPDDTRARVELTSTRYNQHRSLINTEDHYLSSMMPIRAWMPNTVEHHRLQAIAALHRRVPHGLGWTAIEHRKMGSGVEPERSTASAVRNKACVPLAPVPVPDVSDPAACDQWDHAYRAEAMTALQVYEHDIFTNIKRSTDQARLAYKWTRKIILDSPPVATGQVLEQDGD